MSLNDNQTILLSHGGGGQKTSQLISEMILEIFDNPILRKLDDGACINLASSKIVMSTDSYVITPLFFPGGNIGTLAACGTINDLAMQGSKPEYLSLGLILEEGFKIQELQKILKSFADVINPLDIQVVTGDTKVVERGRGNGIFINTTGIGTRIAHIDVHASNALPGDRILLSGTMGDHGMAIMCKREGLNMETTLKSDVAPLWPMIHDLLEAVPTIHVLRDPTRGGVAAALNDIAMVSRCGIRLKESTLPVKPEVHGASSLLGLDPLAIANEGKALIICPPDKAELALSIMKHHHDGRDATEIGTMVDAHQGQVILETLMGGERLVDVPSGEDLPRIC